MEPGWRALIVNAVSSPEQAADDKESMKSQLESNMAICDRHQWDVIDIVDIPGYSRDFLTLRELVEASKADNEPGPGKLEEHIYGRTFDVLVVRSTNRFNRQQSLNAEIITRVIRMGARIFSQADGLIDETNYRAIIAITGFRDAGEIDELKKRRWFGLIGRAQKGLPVSGHVPDSHRLVFNSSTGEPERVELREEFFQVWRDLVTVLLDGVGYNKIELEMFRRYGHSSNGEPYPPGKFMKLLFNPYFWGNNVIRKKSMVSQFVEGLWAFDPSVTPPQGVYMFYKTHQPVYTGEVAEQVQEELRRRTGTQNGAGSRFGTGMFTNLIICDDCHAYFGYQRKRVNGEIKYTYLRCYHENYDYYSKRVVCSNRLQIREERVREWIDKKLRLWINGNSVDFEQAQNPIDHNAEIAKLEQAKKRVDHRLERLFEDSLEVEDDLRLEYRKRIRAAKDEQTRIDEQIRALSAETQHQNAQRMIQQRILERISTMDVDQYWEQSPLVINQDIHSLFGNMRIVVKDGRIIGFFDVRLR